MRSRATIALCLALAFNAGGCAIYEKETTNRGGYLDDLLDRHWLKADSKRMRALRAFAMQVSLARVATVSAKNESDRQLLAIRLGGLTARFAPVMRCAFKDNPLEIAAAVGSPCFYYDSAMLDYSTGLFDLALIALPIEDAKNLVTSVAGSVASPINLVSLLTSLVSIGQQAIKYGRVVGALYRDTIELEVQIWLGTPLVDDRPAPYRVTETHVRALAAAYANDTDNMAAWLAEIKALRDQGLEPVPQVKFFDQLAGLQNYLCDLITREPGALKICKADLPKTVEPVRPVLAPVQGVGVPSAASPAAARKASL